MTEKFTPSKLWHLNTLLSLVEIAGEVTRESVAANAVLVVGHNATLQPYAVHRMYSSLKKQVSIRPEILSL